MRILQISINFFPNVGGVETHLLDLVDALTVRKHQVTVLTYRPLSHKASWKMFESRKNLVIFRIPWLAGYFYKLVKYPLLEFLYLTPGLFLLLPFFILFTRSEVVHAHGISAGAVAVFWTKVLRRRVILSTHNYYGFPDKGLYKYFVTQIFRFSDHVLCLSKQSKKEVKALGLPDEKVTVFTYWIDLELFSKVTTAKKELKWNNFFVVLFVGRLVPEKGVMELLEAANIGDRKIHYMLAGTGPLKDVIEEYTNKFDNIHYLGTISQPSLPTYYSAADIVIVPSTHEEGFGRVILESLACGTPVIAANRGAIPEAMNETVGQLITISPRSINESVEKLYRNPLKLKKLSDHSSKFAKDRYSEKNVQTIISTYK